MLEGTELRKVLASPFRRTHRQEVSAQHPQDRSHNMLPYPLAAGSLAGHLVCLNMHLTECEDETERVKSSGGSNHAPLSPPPFRSRDLGAGRALIVTNEFQFRTYDIALA